MRTPFLSLSARRSRSPVGVAALIVCTAVLSCAAESPPGGADPALIIDDFGDTVVAVPHHRIVSLNPTTTETIFALGAQQRLVGRSTWDTWPAAAREVPDVGSALRPNLERVIAARPDLVLLYASADNREAARRLRAAGVTTAAFRVDSIAHFKRVAIVLGVLVGDTGRARTLVDSISATLDSVRAATVSLRRPTVLLPSWFSPLIVIGGGSHLTELVEMAGGENVYGTLSDPSPQVSLEDVLRRDPELILVTPGGRGRILEDPRWRALRSVREGRIRELDTTVVGRPSVTLGAAAASIARLLHPELRAGP
jgi:iron complex transport system substrate-binding protein